MTNSVAVPMIEYHIRMADDRCFSWMAASVADAYRACRAKNYDPIEIITWDEHLRREELAELVYKTLEVRSA